jgi:hypothetical protein
METFKTKLLMFCSIYPIFSIVKINDFDGGHLKGCLHLKLFILINNGTPPKSLGLLINNGCSLCYYLLIIKLLLLDFDVSLL